MYVYILYRPKFELGERHSRWSTNAWHFSSNFHWEWEFVLHHQRRHWGTETRLFPCLRVLANAAGWIISKARGNNDARIPGKIENNFVFSSPAKIPIGSAVNSQVSQSPRRSRNFLISSLSLSFFLSPPFPHLLLFPLLIELVAAMP